MFPYLALLVRPTLFGIIGITLWYFLHPYTQVDETDKDVFQNVSAFIGVAHALIASLQITQVYSRHQNIKLALALKDQRIFKENSCVRISPIIKMLLGVFSFAIFFMFLLYPFKSIYAGCTNVWLIIFVLYLLWEVAAELDDPYHGVWRITRKIVQERFGDDFTDDLDMFTHGQP
jgi:hypothetical protein